MSLLHKIGSKPVIAALRSPDDIDTAIASRVDNIFFMGGSTIEVSKAVQLAKHAGKGTFIHLDLIKGLSSSDKESVEFIAGYLGADGIVTPKSHLIREAKRHGLYGILHLFIIDSMSLHNGLKLVETVAPDGVELMPGLITKTIAQFAELNDRIPVIASGLIETKSEVMQCLQAGATCLSNSNQQLWTLSFEDL